MKNRLICLALCALLLVPIFSGCGEKNDESDIMQKAEAASRTPVTVSMWMVAEEGTTPEAISLVEEAINKITKSKFKTQVQLSVFTEEEYYEKLDEKFASIEEYLAKVAEEERNVREDAKNGGKAKINDDDEEETTAEPEETVLNEWGIPETKYPQVKEDQLDIIFLAGLDKYMEYINNGYLARLDDELKGTAKKLKTYVHPSFLSAANIDGGTYAIPNNHTIGEYVYLLLNKELVDKYYYDPEKLTSLNYCADFIEDVAKKEKDYAPILRLDYPLYIKYWSDDGSRSLISSIGSAITAENTFLGLKNTLTNNKYTDQLMTVLQYKEKGYMSNDPENEEKFGVAVVKGGAELEKKYGENYYMNVLQYPSADNEEMYKAMFGVSEFTHSLERSMEIITLLNTDSDFRNLLQYGIQGVHYTLDEEDGSVKRLNNDYMMNIINTGNTFIAYPEEGEELDVWEYGKKQNLDSKISPFIRFTLYGTDVDTELMDRIKELSVGYFEKLDECKTSTQLQAYLDSVKEELSSNEDLKSAMSNSNNKSPQSIYNTWYEIKYPPVQED